MTDEALHDLVRRLGGDEAPQLIEAIDQLIDARVRESARLTGAGSDSLARLQFLYAAFIRTHQFSPGQLVRWKEGLRNKRRPDYGVAAIVVEVLDPPRFDDDEPAGSAYFREPLDLVIGFIDADNELTTLHVDSRRVEPA